MLNQAALPRIVPWTGWAEWQAVYGWLYSEDAAWRSMAVKRVGAWKSRGKVPLSVEATATFVEIQLHDNFDRSENEKRMMYSMALTRLINGLVAPYQKSLYAVPIGQVAARIGLPPSLVDLRHQASHNQLPSLVQLRSAAKQALQWLEENYWQRQMDMVEQSRTSISDLLSEYKSLQKAFTAKEKNEEVFDKNEFTVKRKECLKNLISHTSPNQVILALIPLLLDNNYLVPKKTKKVKKFSNLPTRLKTMWTFLLRKCAEQWSHFVPTLITFIIDRIFAVEKLTESLAVQSYHRSILRCWFEYLLQKYYSKKPSSEAYSIFKLASEDDVDVMPLPVKTLVYSALHHVGNRHSLKIVTKLLPLLPEPEQTKVKGILKWHHQAIQIQTVQDEISKLPTYAVTDKMKAAANATSKGDGQLLDIDQFELEVNKRRGLIPQSASENAPSQVTWQLCDDVAGGVGILPNGDVPRLELPVELDDFNLATFLISETELATMGISLPVMPDIPIDEDEYDGEFVDTDSAAKRRRTLDDDEMAVNGVVIGEEEDNMTEEELKKAQKEMQLFVSLDDFIN